MHGLAAMRSLQTCGRLPEITSRRKSVTNLPLRCHAYGLDIIVPVRWRAPAALREVDEAISVDRPWIRWSMYPSAAGSVTFQPSRSWLVEDAKDTVILIISFSASQLLDVEPTCSFYYGWECRVGSAVSTANMIKRL